MTPRELAALARLGRDMGRAFAEAAESMMRLGRLMGGSLSHEFALLAKMMKPVPKSVQIVTMADGVTRRVVRW